MKTLQHLLAVWAVLFLTFAAMAQVEAPPPDAVAGAPAAEDAAVDTSTDFETWYVVLMNGERSGWARFASKTQRNGLIVTSQELSISMDRLGQTVDIHTLTQFTETADHQPVQITHQQSLGAQQTTQTTVFRDDHLEVISGQGGNRRRTTVPLPEGDWLMPAAAARYIEEQLATGAMTITLRTMDASMGPRIVEQTMTLLGETKVEVFGREVAAIEWDMTTTLVPGVKSREFVDASGRTLKSTVNFGGMEMTMLAADEQLARAQIDPPEIMANSLVKPVGDIDNPRRLVRAKYKLDLQNRAEGEKLELPSINAQTVEGDGTGPVTVTVDLRTPANADDRPGEEHLAASTMVNHEDKKIRELVERALGADGKDLSPREKAAKLSRFVGEYLHDKNLGVGFATASETARTASGDCTEHAVLLAALLRAANIPSRTVSGLIYVDGFLGNREVFGYHMWTQAWIADPRDESKSRWIDFDATLRDGGYDAAHITISVSALADGQTFNDMINIMPLMGRLTIEVEATEER